MGYINALAAREHVTSGAKQLGARSLARAVTVAGAFIATQIEHDNIMLIKNATY